MTSRSRPRSESRRNTPLSPPKAPPPAIAPDASNQNKRKTRSTSRDVATAQQQLQNIREILSTVRESEEDVAPVRESDVDDPFSEFGASSTGSSLQDKLDSLNRDAIIDNLEDLYTGSIELISLFALVDDAALRDICKPAAQTNPRLNNKFRTKTGLLLIIREHYGNNHHSGNLDFVEPDLILRKLVGPGGMDGISDAPWRPDAVLSLANLALQVVQVLRPDRNVHLSYLDHMFLNFPDQFLNFDHFQPSLKTLRGRDELEVEVLTQVFLGRVESERDKPGFDPDKVLENIFFDENGRVRGASNAYKMSKILARRESIRRYFDSTSNTFVDFEGLTEKFPWSEFAVHVVRWTVDLEVELKEFIESRGGVDNIVKSLLDGNFENGAFELRHLSDSDNDESKQDSELRVGQEDVTQASYAKGKANTAFTSTNDQDGNIEARNTGLPLGKSVPEQKGGGAALKSNIDLVKAAKARYAAQKSGPLWNMTPQDESESEGEYQPEREAPQSPRSRHDDESFRVGMDEEQDDDEGEDVNQRREHTTGDADDEDFIATQQAAILRDTVRRQKEQSNKENTRATVKKPSFLDPQAGAVREKWDNRFPNDEDIPLPTRRSPKRSRNQAYNDSDEDDREFQTDTRVAKRSRIDVERIRKPASPRARFRDANEDLQETDGYDHDRRTQPQAFASRPRLGSPRAPLREPSTSRERPLPTFPAVYSQPGKSSSQRASSSRAPLQPISSDSRAIPSSSAPARSHTTAPSSPPSSRRLPPSHQDPPRDGSRLPSASQEPPSTQAKRVNQEAKERMQMARDLTQNRRPVQTRVPYSADEINRLSEMIALYGTQWARILREDNAHPEGPVLQGRNQVQLKDKARNMKLDVLKAGERLAPGFELVSVGNVKLQELRLMGIDYFEGEDGARYNRRGARNDAIDD